MSITVEEYEQNRPTERLWWTATDLLTHTFPEPRWAVPGLLPEGLTLLAGPPKVGKSWLSFNIAVAVAQGGLALGALDTQPGKALYLALEDTPRRLQQRLGITLKGSPAPSGLSFATQWPSLSDGGAEMLHELLTAHPDTRLLIVDVLAKIRGSASAGTMYEADYQAISALKRVADDHHIAVIVVHHVRKMHSEDFLDAISGTHGLAGAADTIAVLKRCRGEADATLHITGRDIEEAEHALNFSAECGQWKLLDGPADEHALPDTRRHILHYLREHPAQRPAAIADALQLKRDTVKQTCARMLKDNQLTATADGKYSAAVTGASHPTVTAVTTVTEPLLNWENSEDERGQL